MISTQSTRGWGGQTVVGKLRRVLVYEPIAPDEAVSWEEFGYFRPIDYERATEEHAAFRRILSDSGTEVITGQIGDAQLQDAIFPFDPVIITDRGAILGRMGKELRRREVDLLRETLTDLSVPILGEIKAPGTFEGGDSFWLDERTLAV
ncbi:MAG TPA: arginine deiminase-related protein, partial [Nitrolancea sp.]